MIVPIPFGPVAGRAVGTPNGSVAAFLELPDADVPGAAARFRIAAAAR